MSRLPVICKFPTITTNPAQYCAPSTTTARGVFSNAARPRKSCKKRHHAAEETGYIEANSRSFRQFHRIHGAENDFHIAGGGGVRSGRRIAGLSPRVRRVSARRSNARPRRRGRVAISARTEARAGAPWGPAPQDRRTHQAAADRSAGGGRGWSGWRHFVSLRHTVLAFSH